MRTYCTKGTCSRQILFDVTPDNKVVDVKFIGGCSGNLQGISRLVNGMDIDTVISTLKGIKCRSNTSCPDQLATALEEYKRAKANAAIDKAEKERLKAEKAKEKAEKEAEGQAD